MKKSVPKVHLDYNDQPEPVVQSDHFLPWVMEWSGNGPGREPSPTANGRRPPDFMIVGAVKAGTTWLHTMLERHPRIWGAPIKEVHYFDAITYDSTEIEVQRSRAVEIARLGFEEFPDAIANDTVLRSRYDALSEIPQSGMTEDDYLRMFGHAGEDFVCGEATPDYSVLPRQVISQIYRMNPAMQVFLLIRDPIDRFWSHMQMLKLTNTESVTDLPLQDWYALYTRSYYGTMIRRWRAIFGPRLHLLNFDDIAANPEAVLRDVCGNIGVRYDDSFFPDRHESFLTGTDYWGASAKDAPSEQMKADLHRAFGPVYDDLTALGFEPAAGWKRRHGL